MIAGVRILLAVFGANAALAAWASARAQPLPLGPTRDAGQTVTPAFEGWYKNPDGTFSLSFGYFNRNSKEALDIPIGPDNYFTPGTGDRGQPTHFEPRRQWGVFAVTVPADFGSKRVVWTLVIRGDTVAIPGSLKRNWEIDALQGEAGSGNTPPSLSFDGKRKAAGPGGVWAEPMNAKAGQPVTLTVWASDDGRARTSVAGMGREGVPVSLTWFVHQASVAGAVTFSEASPNVDSASGKATTSVTFSAAGEYVLRVRANDASGIENAGHAQCCWTNGFVRITVTP